MVLHFRNNLRFYFLLAAWWLIGMSFHAAGVTIIVLSVFFFKQRSQNEELLIGFMFILLLSDRYNFAGDVKEVAMVLFSLFLFVSYNTMPLTSKLYFRFLPFFLFAFYCLLFSEQFLPALQKTISYVLLFIVVPNYVENIYRESGKEFFKDVAYYAIATLGIGLVMVFLSQEAVYLEGRYRGVFFVNPNGLGLYCLLVFLLISVLIDFYPTMFERREKIFFYAIILLSIYLTRSRNSLVAVIIFYSFKSFYKISPFLGFIIFITFLFIYQYLIDRLPFVIIYLGLQDYFRIDTLDTGSGRIIAWNFAWTHIETNYFVGKGIAYTEYLYKKNFNYLANLGHQGNAHNSYLTFWLDTGLIGLVLYLFGLVSLFIKAASKTKLAMPILYAILFSAFFESWLTASLNPLMIILLLIITIISSDNIEQTDEIEQIEDQSVEVQVAGIN